MLRPSSLFEPLVNMLAASLKKQAAHKYIILHLIRRWKSIKVKLSEERDDNKDIKRPVLIATIWQNNHSGRIPDQTNKYLFLSDHKIWRNGKWVIQFDKKNLAPNFVTLTLTNYDEKVFFYLCQSFQFLPNQLFIWSRFEEASSNWSKSYDLSRELMTITI